MTTLELQIIVYGSCSRDPENDDRYGAEQRRVEVLLNPVIPADATTLEEKHKWVQGFVNTILRDMKHNRNWRCEFCKKHARETVWMKATWLHLTPPRMNCYVHNVCDTDPNPCSDQLRAVDAEMARLSGFPPGGIGSRARPAPGYDFPMSASCAECHDEAPKSRRNLKQCSRCGLTRYCSVACQRTDWNRHKVCCKAIKDVKWVWN